MLMALESKLKLGSWRMTRRFPKGPRALAISRQRIFLGFSHAAAGLPTPAQARMELFANVPVWMVSLSIRWETSCIMPASSRV